MKAWWQGLQPQEQRTLSIGAVALGLMVFYFGILEPLTSHFSSLEQSVAEQQKLRDWMAKSAAEVHRLQSQGGGVAVNDGRSLLTLVDQTARAENLGPALRRVEPEGSDKVVRVLLEQAPFDDVIRWLQTIKQRHGVNVVSITFDKQPISGMVNARMTLTGGG
ncbi:MAG: type II secretion system protein M [Gammaproteobacteria bacterium]|nr:type II secretion system protein M [Gammaproteobacteria bacterium]